MCMWQTVEEERESNLLVVIIERDIVRVQHVTVYTLSPLPQPGHAVMILQL